MAKQQYEVGQVVVYHLQEYWVYEIKDSRIILLPMDAIDFETNAYELGKLIDPRFYMIF